MSISNVRIAVVVAAAVTLAGCGKQERSEAAAFAKALNGAKASITAADATEKELVANAKGWCAAITGHGSGRGVELDQNAAVATELAKNAVAASAQISQVRQAVDGVTITEEYPRGLRLALINQLTKRQRLLQDVRALLDDAATQFRQYGQSRSYQGDTYPDAIAKLDSLLGSYKPPEDAVGATLASLREKYNFAPNEI